MYKVPMYIATVYAVLISYHAWMVTVLGVMCCKIFHNYITSIAIYSCIIQIIVLNVSYYVLY